MQKKRIPYRWSPLLVLSVTQFHIFNIRTKQKFSKYIDI